MSRLTKHGIFPKESVMFIDSENNYIPLVPCEMKAHHTQLALEKLADYEDKQEQGLMIELPCKVGTTIYIVNRYWHSVEIGNICGFAECDDVCCFCYKVYVDPDTYIPVAIADFGVDWFLTEAEAEEALEKIKKVN